MINSIYSNNEVFLRELLSNASDAIDKKYYLSLTDTKIKTDDLKIKIELDDKNKTISIIDNGIGMNKEDLENNLNGSLGYIHYLISDYKKDRWYRREAFIQMHENLNTAIRAGVRALFYINGFYSPAEDRAVYYSHSLKKLPENYAELISQSCNQITDSEEDYFRREKIFMENIVGFIEKKKSC